MLANWMRNVLIVISAIIVATPVSAANTLDKIKEKGKIVVGVKADYKPWGFLEPSGKIVGLEVDLAQDIADRLGVKLELVPVQTSNRIEFLQQGKINLIIATLSDNEKRRKVVGIVDPNYYAGGTNIMARKSFGFKKWEDLRGKKVCAIQAAYYNKPVATKFGAEIVAFAGIPESQTDLLAGNCVAFLQDSTLIEATLAARNPKWADYEMPLPTIDPQPWGVAVPLEEKEGTYGKFVSNVVVDWHRSGKLIALQKKWGLKPSPFLQEMNKKYKK